MLGSQARAQVIGHRSYPSQGKGRVDRESQDKQNFVICPIISMTGKKCIDRNKSQPRESNHYINSPGPGGIHKAIGGVIKDAKTMRS